MSLVADEWYSRSMSDTRAPLGQKGRLVIPAHMRKRHGWTEGQSLVLVDSDQGVVVMGRDDLKALVRKQLAGPSLVEELLADRQLAAKADLSE